MAVDVDPEPDDATVAFAAVARALLAEHDMTASLHRIVDLAVEHLEPCEYAGISYIERRQVSSPASSDEIPRLLDELQQACDEGPCLDAIRQHEVFMTGDLMAETRWPQFATRAHEATGVCSILAVRLFSEADTMGALNLYSTRLDAFDGNDIASASVFATHAAVAMTAAKREANLERMAQSRDLIGRAKGILMATLHVTDDEAFNLLRVASQRLNHKLTAIAQDVNDTGQLPG